MNLQGVPSNSKQAGNPCSPDSDQCFQPQRRQGRRVMDKADQGKTAKNTGESDKKACDFVGSRGGLSGVSAYITHGRFIFRSGYGLCNPAPGRAELTG